MLRSLQKPFPKGSRHVHAASTVTASHHHLHKSTNGGKHVARRRQTFAPCEAVASTATSLVSAMHDTAARLTPQQSQTANPADKPMLSLRPIRTHVNVMIAGGNNHVGKFPYYRVADEPEATDVPVMADATAPAPSKPEQNTHFSPHASFAEDPFIWASTVGPVLVPEACREMMYTFQDTPGQGACLDPSMHIDCLLNHVLKQQEKDYKILQGCRGLDKGLACGCLKHSPTVCIYTLPPEGPSKADLVVMSVLDEWVALLPIITGAMSTEEGVGQSCQQLVKNMLQKPHLYVPGLVSVDGVSSTASGASAIELPILGVNKSPEQIAELLVRLISTDQVYDLLDLTWEKYKLFCKEYEASGVDKDITRMKEAVCIDWSNQMTTSADYYAGCVTLHEPSRAKKVNLQKLKSNVYKYILDNQLVWEPPEPADEEFEYILQDHVQTDINILARQSGLDYERDASWIRQLWSHIL